MSSQKCRATSSENLPPLKKCKCGSLEHQHITNKDCPMRKVSQAKKLIQPSNSTNTLILTRTIKCTLNSMLLDNSIKPALEDALTLLLLREQNF